MQQVPFDFWMFLAGLGIFLFGMRHLEDGIKGLAGKSFQRIIERFTNRSWKGILTGAFVTGVLQSSSMVMLLVLAFLGAGLLTLKSAIGVVFGANLGTTITAWLVATIGFKVNIADFSFPFLALGILSYLFLDNRPTLKNLGTFLVGFGLLFLGLDYMKVALDEVADQLDLSMLEQIGLWAFLLAGLIVTALIQSSSAMIVIILSALNVNLIDVYQAFAMIIGANIGTTSTMLIGSIKGSADKKRLAFANVIFNISSGVLVFIFIRKIIDSVAILFSIEDALMELVLLNTLLNLSGIILFFPFIGLFERFLKNRFKKDEPTGDTLYVKNISAEFPELGLKALDDELKQVFYYVKDFVFSCFLITNGKEKPSGWKSIFQTAINLNDKYEKIKRIEDELSLFYGELQKQNLTENESKALTRSMMSLRALVYCAKDIKDVMHNIKFMQESEDPFALDLLNILQAFVTTELNTIQRSIEDSEGRHLSSYDLIAQNDAFYHDTISYVYLNLSNQKKQGVPVSTFTNVIKQTVSALNNVNFVFHQKNNVLADV